MNFRDAMNEVLETTRYDFLTERRVDIRNLISRLLERIIRFFFGRFSFAMPGGSESNTGLVAVIFTFVAVVAVTVGVIVFVRSRKRFRAEKKHTLADIFEEIKNHTVKELLELSENAENQRISIRYKYIAVILWLNEKGIIVIEPSATNFLIYKQLESDAPEYTKPFLDIIDAFHEAWFGKKALANETMECFNAAVRQVIRYE